MADAETIRSLPSHVVPSVQSEKVARADVLAGVYDAAKPPGQGVLAKLLRHKLAFGALPQNVVLGPAEAKVLELKLDTGEEATPANLHASSFPQRASGLGLRRGSC